MNGAVENVCAREDGAMGEGRPEDGMATLLLSWIDWVEVEVRGFPDQVDEMEKLRGAVMVARIAGGLL